MLDNLVGALLFFAAIAAPSYFLGQWIILLFRDPNERSRVTTSVRDEPWAALKNTAFMLAYYLFFGSLFLASLGVPTFGK